jgi:tRNA threonylcarbamoyladenosine biosynthesis protein TsaE
MTPLTPPIPIATDTRIELADEDATGRLAGRLAALARVGDVLALSGDLGTGKTAFARAFLRARYGRELEVPSPTFTLVQVYGAEGAGVPVYHFDLFRIDHPDDAFELGIEDAFNGGVSLIEWPDRLGRWLPDVRLDLHLAFGDGPSARRATLSGGGDWPKRLAAHLDDRSADD